MEHGQTILLYYTIVCKANLSNLPSKRGKGPFTYLYNNVPNERRKGKKIVLKEYK